MAGAHQVLVLPIAASTLYRRLDWLINDDRPFELSGQHYSSRGSRSGLRSACSARFLSPPQRFARRGRFRRADMAQSRAQLMRVLHVPSEPWLVRWTPFDLAAIVRAQACQERKNHLMGLFTEFFAWWTGNTIGTRLFTWRRACAWARTIWATSTIRSERRPPLGHLPHARRAFARAARMACLAALYCRCAADGALQPRPWEQAHRPNMTGTHEAYRPPGRPCAPKPASRRWITSPGSRRDERREAARGRTAPEAVQRWTAADYAQNGRFVQELAGPIFDMLAQARRAHPRSRLRRRRAHRGDHGVRSRRAWCRSERRIACCRAHEGPGGAQGRRTCARLRSEFDAVFSNAALHWMREPELRDRRRRPRAEAWRPLRRRARRAWQCRGDRNRDARGGRRRGGDPALVAPWFFPTVEEYGRLLNEGGFAVKRSRSCPARRRSRPAWRVGSGPLVGPSSTNSPSLCGPRS